MAISGIGYGFGAALSSYRDFLKYQLQLKQQKDLHAQGLQERQTAADQEAQRDFQRFIQQHNFLEEQRKGRVAEQANDPMNILSRSHEVARLTGQPQTVGGDVLARLGIQGPAPAPGQDIAGTSIPADATIQPPPLPANQRLVRISVGGQEFTVPEAQAATIAAQHARDQAPRPQAPETPVARRTRVLGEIRGILSDIDKADTPQLAVQLAQAFNDRIAEAAKFGVSLPYKPLDLNTVGKAAQAKLARAERLSQPTGQSTESLSALKVGIIKRIQSGDPSVTDEERQLVGMSPRPGKLSPAPSLVPPSLNPPGQFSLPPTGRSLYQTTPPAQAPTQPKSTPPAALVGKTITTGELRLIAQRRGVSFDVARKKALKEGFKVSP